MSRQTPLPPPPPAFGEPFETAADAWFWCVACETALHDGARLRAGMAQVPRPCEPVDVLRAIDRLYRQRMLLPDHLRVLMAYGRRFLKPDPSARKQRRAARLWDEALARIEPALRRKGIVA